MKNSKILWKIQKRHSSTSNKMQNTYTENNSRAINRKLIRIYPSTHIQQDYNNNYSHFHTKNNAQKRKKKH